MNIGVATGFFPTKGIPLPFVSHGSSSLLVFLTMSGILAKLAKLRGESQKYEPKGY